MIVYGPESHKSITEFLKDMYARLFGTLTDNEISALESLDGRANAFIAKNDSAYLDARFSISSMMFANEIILGESVLSGDIESGLVFRTNAALLCLHASRSIGSCNSDTDTKPFGCGSNTEQVKDNKYTDAHLIGFINCRASQFLRESYIRTPSYDERGFTAEMNTKITSGKLSANMFTELDEIFSEAAIFPLAKSKSLAIEIINAAMSLSILCRSGLNNSLPLLFYDLKCAGILAKNEIKNTKELERFIFDQFWSGAYFSVVRGIRNLDYASDEGSMVVGSLYSNLLKYEGTV